ncbi:MAG: chemotaxis protein CheD [Spirochaetia bacterium]|nr:chemotaxis protein CheD [Spirochaetia bacterium]
MNTPDFIVEIFLQPGEFYWGDSDSRVRTILGSCVALCLWHPKLKIGGMCHYLLASRAGEKPAGEKYDPRYGAEVMEMILHEIEKAKTKPRDYHVKIFGGGNMFANIQTDRVVKVGDKNVALAEEFVSKYNFQVMGKHVKGEGHRSIALDLWSGNVWLKRPQTAEAK